MFRAVDESDWAIDGVVIEDAPATAPESKAVATQKDFEKKQELAALLKELQSHPIEIERSIGHRIAWGLCWLWNLGWFIAFSLDTVGEKNALPLAARAAQACVFLIAGYVGTKAITEVCD